MPKVLKDSWELHALFPRIFLLIFGSHLNDIFCLFLLEYKYIPNDPPSNSFKSGLLFLTWLTFFCTRIIYHHDRDPLQTLYSFGNNLMLTSTACDIVFLKMYIAIENYVFVFEILLIVVLFHQLFQVRRISGLEMGHLPGAKNLKWSRNV